MDRDVVLPHLVGERLGDLGIDEGKEFLAAIDQRHPHAEGTEHRGILGADDPGTDHGERAGELAQAEDAVGSDERLPIGHDPARQGRLGAGGDDHHLRLDLHRLRRPLCDEMMRIEEAGGAVDDHDAVPAHLVADHLDLAPDHVVAAEEKILHRDLLFQGVGGAVEAPLLETGQVEDRLAEGLGGDRAGVDADAADDLPPFANADPPAELGGLDGGVVPGRAGSDDEDVERFHAAHLGAYGRNWQGWALAPAIAGAARGGDTERRYLGAGRRY